MEGRPDVTVIVPAFNAETTIEQALSSVLTQEDVRAETIIVDDGSTDATAEVASHLVAATPGETVRLLRHPGGANRGVAASRNLALANARAAIVAFLDADDYFLPGALAAGVQVFGAFADVVLVYGRVEPAGAGPADTRFVGAGVPGHPFSLARWLLFENPLPTSGTMVRLNAILDTGFPQGLRHQIEDWAAWLAVSQRGPAFFVDRQLACYRRSPASWSARLEDRWLRHAQSVEEAAVLRSFARGEERVAAGDLRAALAYRAGTLMVEAAGQVVRLRLGDARRCLATARAVAGSPRTLAGALVLWMPRIRVRAWFPRRNPVGPPWRRFTAS